jgi:hypothetical protein
LKHPALSQESLLIVALCPRCPSGRRLAVAKDSLAGLSIAYFNIARTAPATDGAPMRDWASSTGE